MDTIKYTNNPIYSIINSDKTTSMIRLLKCFNGEICKNIPFELL